MLRTELPQNTIRVSALLIALLVFGVRAASPVLHHHALTGDSAQHVQQDGCPSCDVEATQALDDAAPAVLPVSPSVGDAANLDARVIALPAPHSLSSFGRAPPADLI